MTRTDLAPLGLSRRHSRDLSARLRMVLDLEEEMRGLADDGLRERLSALRPGTSSLSDRVRQVEVFAVVREAAFRVLGELAYPVQVLGALSIADGCLAEMSTGEGKTLTSTMPIVWHALSGRGVHVATANPYLASRDASTMGEVYSFLGLTTGTSLPGMGEDERRRAYRADVTYSTAAQLGFDYLSDNLVYDLGKKLQRPHHAAVVDEADALLIDEARTPLVISSPDRRNVSSWERLTPLVASLTEDEYEVDRSENAAHLTEAGLRRVEVELEVENLYDHPSLVHHVHAALQARVLFVRDRDYLVAPGPDGQEAVVIVDAQTGRMMPTRRFQNSLHEALEAKEGLKVRAPSRTAATVTIQSYFSLYTSLGGMTGTASGDADELARTYGTIVARIPTHRPMVRRDLPDLLYATAADKEAAVVEEVRRRSGAGQPILLGTLTVEESEHYSHLLSRAGIEHVVLNARNHFTEARAISQAGRRGAVTISTNMAGRGVDIKLGGDPVMLLDAELNGEDVPEKERSAMLEGWREVCANEREEVLEAGGLYVLATGRNTSRRIDDQLRGRSGRQGEPGMSRFFTSCDDDLVATFGGNAVAGLVDRLASAPGQPVTSRLLLGVVDRSQRRIEAIHAQQRRSLLTYDRVGAAQRESVYRWRDRILSTPFEELCAWWLRRTYRNVLRSAGIGTSEVDRDSLATLLEPLYPGELPEGFSAPERLSLEEGISLLMPGALAGVEEKFALVLSEYRAGLLRQIYLQLLDDTWGDHLASLELAEEGVFLYQVAKQDPRTAYTEAARELFVDMVETVLVRSTRMLWQLTITPRGKSAEEPASESTDSSEKSPSVNEMIPAALEES